MNLVRYLLIFPYQKQTRELLGVLGIVSQMALLLMVVGVSIGKLSLSLETAVYAGCFLCLWIGAFILEFIIPTKEEREYRRRRVTGWPN